MNENSNLITFLEMAKNFKQKAIKTSYGDTLKFDNGIEMSFDSNGNFTGFTNNQNPYERTSQITGLLEKISTYFKNMFPKLNEDAELKATEDIIEEGLILTKHIKSPLLEEELWERLKGHFIDKYPHLDTEGTSALAVIGHALVLSEDERLRKKNSKKKPPKGTSNSNLNL